MQGGRWEGHTDMLFVRLLWNNQHTYDIVNATAYIDLSSFKICTDIPINRIEPGGDGGGFINTALAGDK